MCIRSCRYLINTRTMTTHNKSVQTQHSMSFKNITKNLLEIYEKSVIAVRPENLFNDKSLYNFTPTTNKSPTILVNGKKYNVADKKLHIVGFGKAVLGMAAKLNEELGSAVYGGILSVPIGAVSKYRSDSRNSDFGHLKVFEGGMRNLPDEASLASAQSIKNYVSQLKSNDILFVLITGGGSALLPMPRPPLTISDKVKLIKNLSSKGATIVEINIVRIALSDIKGGRLGAAAKNCSMVFTFILSDILDDPIDLIASGPTCEPVKRNETAFDILRKYELWCQLPKHIQKLINTPIRNELITQPKENVLLVVGNNKLATKTALTTAEKLGYEAFVVSNTVQGLVDNMAKTYEKLMLTVVTCIRNSHCNKDTLLESYPFDKSHFDSFLKKLHSCIRSKKPLLLILGGEPTVRVSGHGQGGRNQELAMRLSLAIYNNPELQNCVFLSAGTDGIDGPTPSAGAFAAACVMDDFLVDGTLEAAQNYLLNNDSYHFYSSIRNGFYHINTGHTGTNVADLHLILFQRD